MASAPYRHCHRIRINLLDSPAARVAYESLALASNSVSEPDRIDLKLPAPKFHSSRPAQNQPATVMAWRLPNERIRSGRVPAARNRIRSRTKSSFCGCRILGCKALALRELQRFRGRVENEIGKGGNLGTILVAVRCLLVSRSTVDVSQITQTSRLGRVVSLEPRQYADLHLPR